MTPSWPKRTKRLVRFALVRALLAIVSRLPLPWASAAGERLGLVAGRLAAGERRKALASLQRAFPELPPAEHQALVDRCFRHLGRMAFELACISQLDRDIERHVEWPEPDRAVLDQALARGRGVVFVSGHVGNWELLARRVALAGYPSQSIAKEASDAHLTALIEAFRRSGRLKTIWRGQPGAAKQMLRALKAGEILGLLIDQDTKVQSVFVPFFGDLASTPRAAADLALRTGAPLIVGFCVRAQGRHRISMEEVPASADPTAVTAELTARIERTIRAYPEQWVWMHQRWKTKPTQVVDPAVQLNDV